MSTTDKLKSKAQIKKKAAGVAKEYATLPQFSMFGTNNHVNRDAAARAFEFLLAAKSVVEVRCRIDDVYDEKDDAGESDNPESEYDREVEVLEWGIGQRDDDSI